MYVENQSHLWGRVWRSGLTNLLCFVLPHAEEEFHYTTLSNEQDDFNFSSKWLNIRKTCRSMSVIGRSLENVQFCIILPRKNIFDSWTWIPGKSKKLTNTRCNFLQENEWFKKSSLMCHLFKNNKKYELFLQKLVMN